MIGDTQIQADIISKLKNIVTGTVVTREEVRELQWQGDEFVYPNIRVDLESNLYYFDEQERCSLQSAEFTIYVFSEMRSSKECSQIKDFLATTLIGLGFTGTYAKYTRLRLVDNIPAIREDARTWRSAIKLQSRVQNLP